MAEDHEGTDEFQEAVPEGPRLEPLPTYREIGWRWFAALVGVTTAGMFWLAVRQESDPADRRVLDALSNLAVGGLLAYVAYRVLVRFAFQIFDLLTIILLLSGGVKVTIDAFHVLAAQGIIFEGRVTDTEQYPTVLLACLVNSSILMLGAALGLRYCFKLRIAAPLRRVAAVTAGTLSFPAAAAFPVYTLEVLGQLVTLFVKNGELQPEWYDHAFASVLIWIASFLVSIVNAFLFLRSVAVAETVAVGNETRMP